MAAPAAEAPRATLCDVSLGTATDVVAAAYTDETIDWFRTVSLTPSFDAPTLVFSQRQIDEVVEGAHSVFACDVDGDADVACRGVGTT